MSGRIHGIWLTFLGSVVVLIALVAVLAWPERRESAAAGNSLFLYCAAGLNAPVSEAAAEYEKSYGVKVQVQYAGSNTLLANVTTSRSGDLYLPADDSYIQMARKASLIDEVIPVARMRPVIGVRKGNPRKIHSIDDLLRDGIRMSQANPDAAAIGQVTRAVLRKTGRWDAIQKRVTVEKGTVNDVATDIQVGSVDAGFVWDAIVRQTKDLEAVEVSDFAGVAASISVAVLKSSRQPTAALRFARFLSARDKGLRHFSAHGFEPVEGDAWAYTPELRLFSGAMLRPAIEDTIAAFEQREGVKVIRVYNGCGILVAEMKQGQRPDAYFACDASFMRLVGDIFPNSAEISANRIVIITAKGNPRGIRSLEDLGAAGLRVGIGHEQQSALGLLTKQMLMDAGQYDRIMKNVVVQSATGDQLINQFRTGSLDAALAYASNAAASRKEVDVIGIDLPGTRAIQPYAVARNSPNRHLAGRLLRAIQSVQSRQRFEENGFEWRVAE